MRRMKEDNTGFSLVELIIVVAIIAAVITVSILSISLIFSANAKTCANDIMGAISECKVMTMSRGQGNVRLLIYRSSDGDVFSELQIRESVSDPWMNNENGAEKIGAKRCAVGAALGSDDLPTKSSNTLPTLDTGMWEIYFDRSSGSFKNETSVSDIYVSGGNRNYQIHLEKLTGKSTMERLPSP